MSRGGGFSRENLSFVDGWKIGVTPDQYGFGAMSSGTNYGFPASIGGGGTSGNSSYITRDARIGGGGGGSGNGGTGLVGIEVIA